MTHAAESTPVKGYEGRYEVSRTGHVVSLCSGNPAVLRPVMHRQGYKRVRLYDGRGGYRWHMVHRLVAAAFVGGDKSLQVNHKNGVKGDNRAENLEWVTQKENWRHAADVLYPHKKIAVAMTDDGRILQTFPSMSDAARQTGSRVGGISHCCKGNRRSHNGYGWQYA